MVHLHPLFHLAVAFTDIEQFRAIVENDIFLLPLYGSHYYGKNMQFVPEYANLINSAQNKIIVVTG